MDSALINPPVSSPLHPQLNLPLLKSQLAGFGFDAQVIDANIDFYLAFLGDDCPRIGIADCDENPLNLLSYYNDLEDRLSRRSKDHPGLNVGLRSLSMKYDRLHFSAVLEALEDRSANPFRQFFEGLIESQLRALDPKIVGVAISFQDQIIPAFTLATVLRELLPNVRIVMGGQMITRCATSMISDDRLRQWFDYLVLWDGELPLVDLHRHIINDEEIEFVNIVPADGRPYRRERASQSLRGDQLPSPDFSDLDFSKYLFPEMLVPLQTTRGCYARCSFCAIPYGSNKYRVRDGVEVADEIERIQDETVAKYGRPATFFKFMEDTSAPSTLLKLSSEIERRGLDAKWETFARLEKAFAADGVMDALYRGGCRKIHWGLETNDPDILMDMHKNTVVSYTDTVLESAGRAGILNFCFILVGFPGETEAARERLIDYIADNPHIHTLTVASFDLTRNSPMDEDFVDENEFGLERTPAEEFQVRLPYMVNGRNWKQEIVSAAHHVMAEIARRRPDIGFVTLFPDQIRAMFCDKFGNDWGRQFVDRFGEENVREMLLNIEEYVANFETNAAIDVSSLPEPLKREHFRTKEDMALLAQAVRRRRIYETQRIEQV